MGVKSLSCCGDKYPSKIESLRLKGVRSCVKEEEEALFFLVLSLEREKRGRQINSGKFMTIFHKNS